MYNVNKNHKKTATAPHNTRRCIWQCMALIVCVVLIIGAVIALADAYYDSTPPPLYEYIYTTGYNYAGEYSESNLPPSYEYSSAYVYGYADEYSSSYYGHSYSYGTVYYDYEQTYANEAPVYSQEYDNQSGGYYHEYIPGHINDAPTYLYDTFINVHAVIGMPGAEFTAIVESLTGTGHGGTTQFLLQYINTVNASIYGVYEITAPRLEGYNLVYWLSADLDSYGTPNFYSPVMISNTYPDSDYDHYHTANVVLSQTGGTRVYAVFMPVEYDMARGGIVPFGSPVPPFWVEFDANLGTLGTGQSPRITIINQPLANPPFGRIGVNFPTPPTMLGRQFVGWSIPPIGDGPAFTGSCDVFDNDLTVYARWGFEVIFSGNGVALPAAQTSFLIPDTARIEGPHSANSSYQFAWIMRSPGPSLPAVLVPPWPVDPVRPGWIFEGWYTVAAQSGGIRHDADTPVGSTLHLFARWTPTNNHTITFVPGPGASIVGSNTRQVRSGLGLMPSTEYPIGLNPGYLTSSFVRTPMVVAPDGLNFVGWWTAPGGPSGSGVFAGWGRTANATHGTTPGYMWPAGHTNPDGSMAGWLHNIAIYDDMNVYAYYVKRVRFDINGPDTSFVGVTGTGSGFRPLNQSAGATRGAVVDFPANAPSNATVASHGRYMGINTGTPGIGVYGAFSEFELPPVPQRPGYEFVGWFSIPGAGGTEFTVNTPLDTFPWQNPARRQVFARWIQNTTITITFDANGGQWYPDQVSTIRAGDFPASIQQRTIVEGAVGTSIAQWNPGVPVAVPRRQGHVFMGWYEDPGTTIRFEGHAPTDANRTFWARWSDAVVTVTFRRDMQPHTSALGVMDHVVYLLPAGTTWRDRANSFVDPAGPPTALNLRPLVNYNEHHIESGVMGPAISQHLVNPFWTQHHTSAAERAFPFRIRRPGGELGTETFFPLSVQANPVANEMFPFISRGGLWNSVRDAEGRGTGQWWDVDLPVTHDMVFYDIWQTEITFDRNHRAVVPTAYNGPNSRMTIQVPIGYSLGNRHTHPLFEYGGDGTVPTASGPTPPPASGTTTPYFTNRSDRRVWLDAPDTYTWRPRNPMSLAAMNPNHHLVTSDVAGEWALVGWNTDSNYPGYYDENTGLWVQSTGEWFDLNRVLSWDNGRTYYAIWGQVVAFNIGHAQNAGGIIAPEHRTRAVVFPGTWGALEGVGLPYPVMVDPVWPGPVGLVPEFAGWNTHRDGLGTAFDRDEVITGPTHLYALWRANVYFGINTPDVSAVGGGQVSDIIVGQTVGYVEASIPATRTNWVFRQWNREADASGAIFYPHATQVDNITTVYAIWDGIVTFDPNGGTMGPPSQIGGLNHAIREGQTIATSRQGNVVSGIGVPSTPWPTTGGNAWFGGMPANPTRLNHSFQGWWFQDENDNWIQFTAATVMDMGNITVVARWRGPQMFSFYKTDGLATTPTGWPELPRLQGAQFFLDQYDSVNNIYVQVAGPFTSGVDGRVDLVIPYPRWYTNGEFRLREVPPFGFETPSNWRLTVSFTTSAAGDVITLTKERYNPADTTTPMFERGYEEYFCTEADDYIPVFYGWFLGNRRIVALLNIHKTGPGILAMNPPPTNLSQLNNMHVPGAIFALYRYTGPGTPDDGQVPAAGWVRHGEVQTSTNNPLTPMVFGVGFFYRYYQLVELVPPPGHMAPFGQWRLTLTFDTAANALTGMAVDPHGDSITPPLERLTGEQGFVFAVGNRLDFELPLAGGSGRSVYIYSGMFMLFVAVVAMVYIVLGRVKQKQKV